MKKSEILRIIKEEVEVVLTNEEAAEVFDLDPASLLDEMCGENPYAVNKATPSAAGFHDTITTDINDPGSESEYAQLISKFRDRVSKK